DHDHEFDAALGRVVHGRFHARRGDEDARGVGAGGRDRVGNGGVNGDALHVVARLLGVGAGDDLRAVRAVAQAVEAPLGTGKALVDDLGVPVDEDAHDAARETAVRAASSIVGFD